mmetsp:Transcript_34269/g.63927  ORF Transcript_34269/g.63927 Transcript_34269/m.63927 type:complete len:227 (+) Transcript_34269:96-776(+)
MTTAHRPTWNSAIAGGTTNAGGNFVCQTTKVNNRDAASFTTLKTRQVGQAAPIERGSIKSFREDLERRENKARAEREGRPVEEADKKRRQEPAAIADNPFPEDADDVAASGSEKEESEDDEEEDTEELMRELAKIKQEREQEEEREKERQKKQDERSRRDEIMQGNPLLSGGGSTSLKRKWDDDTVFKNQARTAPVEKARFINDAVRSDFHRKFLNKYVWVDGTAH